jgi:hypothetical protein
VALLALTMKRIVIFLKTGIEYKYSYLCRKVYNESVFLVFGYGKCMDSEGEKKKTKTGQKANYK